jgi:hypothetical protein
VEAAVEDTLAYYAFPEEHWRRIRTNNPLERILREIRWRTRVVGAFPDGQSALNLAAENSSGVVMSVTAQTSIEIFDLANDSNERLNGNAWKLTLPQHLMALWGELKVKKANRTLSSHTAGSFYQHVSICQRGRRPRG